MKFKDRLKKVWGGAVSAVLFAVDVLVVSPFQEIQRADSLSEGVFLAILILFVDAGLIALAVGMVAWAVFCPKGFLACLLPPSALVGLVWLVQRNYRRRMEKGGEDGRR